MLDLLKDTYWYPHTWLYQEEYLHKMEKCKIIAEKFFTIGLQTEIDYVECIVALRRFIEGDNLGILKVEEYITS